MDDDADREYFKATEVRTTPKSRQVRLEKNGEEFCVPKSVSGWHRDGILMVESWFAKKEGMLD